MMPDYASAFPSGQASGVGRGTAGHEPQEASAALNYSLATTMQQFFQQQVSPMLEQVLMSQEIVMTRLDRLEQDQQVAAGQQRESGNVMEQLQRLTLGRPARGFGQDAGSAAALNAGSSLDVVMTESVAVSEQPAFRTASVDVQQSDSQVFSASAEKSVKDPNPTTSLAAHQESVTKPSRAGDGVTGQGVTMVEGVPYAWRVTPEGLKLQRLDPPQGSSCAVRGRTSEAVPPQTTSGTRTLSTTSAEIKRMTPNIRRFHSTSPPRSRSSPKPRPSVLKKSPESSAVSIQQTPSDSRKIVPLKPKIVYPCTPGGTEIKPPPRPDSATVEAKVMGQQAAQSSGGWFSSRMLGSEVPTPPPLPPPFVCLCDCRSCCCCAGLRAVCVRGRFGGWGGFCSLGVRGFRLLRKRG